MSPPPEVFHALADATRWEIVRQLADGPRCVCELTASLDLPQSTLSTHLQVLRAGGLLLAERRGRWMYYGIARSARPLLKSLWKHFPAGSAAGGVPAAPADCCRNSTLVNKTSKRPLSHDPH